MFLLTGVIFMPNSIVDFQMHLIIDLEYLDVILDDFSMYNCIFKNLQTYLRSSLNRYIRKI